MQAKRQVSEIARRNVKQVLQTLIERGLAYEQTLVNQYLNGEKSQYQFLLPKSKNHSYYQQQLATCLNQEKPRKFPNHSAADQTIFGGEDLRTKQKDTKKITVIGKVDQISVGAMCELIKELRQNKQPYQPYHNEIYEQQLTLNLKNHQISAQITPILQMIHTIKNPNLNPNSKPNVPQTPNTKMDFLRTELGTEKDGSMGTWGGKKYEGLGMRDQFTNYRKQLSKNFYAHPR